MPIKPMDMQVLLPNVQKAAKADNVKSAKQDMASQQSQAAENRELEINKNKISNVENKDQNDLKNDQKENQKESETSKRKKKEKEEEDKKIQMREHGSTFDIKV